MQRRWLGRGGDLSMVKSMLLQGRLASTLASESMRTYGSILKGLGGTGSIHLTTDESIATVTISNPGKKNALSPKMMCDLSDILVTLEDSYKGVGVVLKGDACESFFCSGADLSFVRDDRSDTNEKRKAGEAMCAFMQNLLTRFSRLPLISVAVLDGGGAVGGGTELALSCDFRTMHRDATFRMVHTSLGLSPGWAGGTRLVKTVGRKRAIEILAAGTSVNADAALEIGLVDKVSADGNALHDALEILRPYSSPSLDSRAVRDAKLLIGTADDLASVDDSLEYEREIFIRRWSETVCPRAT